VTVTLLEWVIVAVLIGSMSSKNERFRALLLAVFVLILSTTPSMNGVRETILSVTGNFT
jgi:hypothetical protein